MVLLTEEQERGMAHYIALLEGKVKHATEALRWIAGEQPALIEDLRDKAADTLRELAGMGRTLE